MKVTIFSAVLRKFQLLRESVIFQYYSVAFDSTNISFYSVVQVNSYQIVHHPSKWMTNEKKIMNKVAAIMKVLFLESTIVQSATPTTLTEQNIDQREHCSIMKNVASKKSHSFFFVGLSRSISTGSASDCLSNLTKCQANKTRVCKKWLFLSCCWTVFFMQTSYLIKVT